MSESIRADGLNQRISDDGDKFIGEVLDNINPSTPEQTNIEKYYISGSDWAKGINLEHHVPIGLSQYSKLGTSNPFYKTLNSIENLSLVHRECHTISEKNTESQDIYWTNSFNKLISIAKNFKDIVTYV